VATVGCVDVYWQSGILCHFCTDVPHLEGGSLAPMTFTPEDGRKRPRRQVPLLWMTSSVRRAIEHVMASHYSAMHIFHGFHIVIVGPGAANNFHAKVINPNLPRNGSAVGRDITTENLPFSANCFQQVGHGTLAWIRWCWSPPPRY